MTKEKQDGKKVENSISTIHVRGPEPEDGLLQELNRFEVRLNKDAERGKPIFYDVKIDGLPVIHKTKDPSAFPSVLDDIDFARTKEIEIRLFTGNSTYNHKHLIFIDKNRNPQPETPALAGFDERFDLRLADMRRSWDHDLLQKEHAELKRRFDALEEYRDRLEEELEEYRSKRLHLGNLDLIEVGGMLLEGFIRRNPQALARFPGGEALAGALLAGGSAPQVTTPINEGQATVSRRQTPQATDEELEFLQVIRRVQERFNEGEFMQVLAIIDHLSRNPARIPATLACAGRDATDR